MAKRSSRRRKSRRRVSSAQHVGVQRAATGWMLTHPKCAQERADDIDEVRQMIDAGEADVAIDELRWLLADCSEMIEAHFLLGKLAVEVDEDVPLARGHFGFGYQAGARALRRADNPAPLPALHPANRAFFDCGRGLAWALHRLGKSPMAVEVIEHLLECDSSDPLKLAGWLDEMNAAGLPIIEL